jgi:hypothetical protein
MGEDKSKKADTKSADKADKNAPVAASTAAPPARKEGSQENSEGAGVGGTDDTAEGEDDEEVHPKVSKVKMTPRGGRHEPYEKKEGKMLLSFCIVVVCVCFCQNILSIQNLFLTSRM